MLKWIRELSHEFGPQGATITPIGSGHYRLNLPNGRRVTLPGTPSDHRSIHNIRAKVRRCTRPVEAESNVVELAAPEPEVITHPANVIIELQGIIEPPATPKGEVLYHHTCTAHLPYILQAASCGPDAMTFYGRRQARRATAVQRSDTAVTANISATG